MIYIFSYFAANSVVFVVRAVAYSLCIICKYAHTRGNSHAKSKCFLLHRCRFLSFTLSVSLVQLIRVSCVCVCGSSVHCVYMRVCAILNDPQRNSRTLFHSLSALTPHVHVYCNVCGVRVFMCVPMSVGVSSCIHWFTPPTLPMPPSTPRTIQLCLLAACLFRSAFSRIWRFLFWWRRERRQCAEQHSSSGSASPLPWWPLALPLAADVAACLLLAPACCWTRLLHTDREQRLRMHSMTVSCAGGREEREGDLNMHTEIIST